jgi:hexosaminidase
MAIRRDRKCVYIVSGLLPVVMGWQACAAEGESSSGQDAGKLRLIPFPRQVHLRPERLPLADSMVITIDDSPVIRQAAEDLKGELSRMAKVKAEILVTPAGAHPSPWLLGLSAGQGSADRAKAAPGVIPPQDESYALTITGGLAAVGAEAEAGLVWGIQTLRQLVRANLQQRALPGLQIQDWPALRYRGFQDDMTRGPSSTLDTLEGEVRMSALLKLNYFTYYMEHQFAFKKYPFIGPKDGSFTPEELRALVQYAKRYGLEIIGDQQSLAHLTGILKHKEFWDLRETPNVLNPTVEATYQLLDGLYSEQLPLLESKFFSVNCDETGALGRGASKSVAEKIGVGALYTKHVQRVHGLVTGKHGKRIMLAGDMTVRYPEYMKEIPKDTIMVAWAYEALPSFDGIILPFKQAGFDFFISPGVSCWKSILPDFGIATTNIRNFVRDGVKYGAMGMLNTTWDDNGENLFPVNWPGLAWGADCAWNASSTTVEDFNRRIGAILFGEENGEFGQAVELLTRTHRLEGYDGMRNRRFWRLGLGPEPVDEAAARRQAEALLAIIDPALARLQRTRGLARLNAEWIDSFVFGAQRMRLLATRTLAALDAARACEEAGSSGVQLQAALAGLRQAGQKLIGVRDEHERLKKRYIELWNRENRPYALDRVTAKYEELISRYGAIIRKLRDRIDTLEKNGRPSPDQGLKREILELGSAARLCSEFC